MTNHDRSAFATTLAALAELPNGVLTDTRIEAYWLALNDLDLAVFQAASACALRSCRFFPSPAEIREFAEGSTDDRGQRAWAQIWQAGKSIGAYRSIRLEDPATAAALVRTFGSWPRFCQAEMEPPMQAAKRKEFLANYRLASRQPGDPSVLSQPGLAEIHNRDTATTWGDGHHPHAQTRGVLSADGRITDEPMVIDPTSGRLLPPSDVPQLMGDVEPSKFVPMTRQRFATFQAAARKRRTRGSWNCPECGITEEQELHQPDCAWVAGNPEHEERIRRQAKALLILDGQQP